MAIDAGYEWRSPLSLPGRGDGPLPVVRSGSDCGEAGPRAPRDPASRRGYFLIFMSMPAVPSANFTPWVVETRFTFTPF